MSGVKVWWAFKAFWFAIFVGFSDELMLDQAKKFHNTEFRSVLSAAGIAGKEASVGSHDALGMIKRHQTYLRTVRGRLRAEHLKMSTKTFLKLRVTACHVPDDQEGLISCMTTMHREGSQMSKIMAKRAWRPLQVTGYQAQQTPISRLMTCYLYIGM